ncbi:uncharacterized protein PGRI_092330 [Penicillium griseofulvum]|uniref:Uncharacterized protein n=1 Tax=Penicillium patulum TaxID=5078 RepID=A0A135LSA6_PENPA|nr:uncharacterized protein PGRI_092330 [Penicillium griseofulvum]KXG51840.1 hypothetical protein PGRI_092330 [Penicillium griseofulvum]
MALTCFHCINPSEKGADPTLVETIRSWRQEGIKPVDSLRTKLQDQQPSSTAVEEKIKSLKDEIRTIEENQQYIDFREVGSIEDIELQLGRHAARMFSNMDKTLSELKDFLREINAFQAENRGSFGPVYAGSGFRITGKPSSNLDWALIEIPDDRVGDNITPDGYYLKSSPIPEDLDEMPVFIHGQRSGYRKGIKNPLECAALTHEIEDGKVISRITYEHSIVPQRGSHFSEPGDSGSLVFTESHVVVGMLFAGGQSHRLSFFTPIETIIEDIKNITKATDVRLKIERSETFP